MHRQPARAKVSGSRTDGARSADSTPHWAFLDLQSECSARRNPISNRQTSQFETGVTYSKERAGEEPNRQNLGASISRS